MDTKSSKLKLQPSMKKFNRMSMGKGKRYVNYLKYLDEEIEGYTQNIGILMNQVNRLKEAGLPSLEELREWNIIK